MVQDYEIALLRWRSDGNGLVSYGNNCVTCTLIPQGSVPGSGLFCILSTRLKASPTCHKREEKLRQQSRTMSSSISFDALELNSRQLYDMMVISKRKASSGTGIISLLCKV